MLPKEDVSSEEEVQQKDHPGVPTKFQETYHSSTQPIMVLRGEGRTKTRFDDPNLVNLGREKACKATKKDTSTNLFTTFNLYGY